MPIYSYDYHNRYGPQRYKIIPANRKRGKIAKRKEIDFIKWLSNCYGIKNFRDISSLTLNIVIDYNMQLAGLCIVN